MVRFSIYRYEFWINGDISIRASLVLAPSAESSSREVEDVVVIEHGWRAAEILVEGITSDLAISIARNKDIVKESHLADIAVKRDLRTVSIKTRNIVIRVDCIPHKCVVHQEFG